MREISDGVRAVEAALFAAEEPLAADEIALHVGTGVDVAAALAELEAHYAGRGVELVERGGAGISRPRRTLPISCGASGRRAGG